MLKGRWTFAVATTAPMTRGAGGGEGGDGEATVGESVGATEGRGGCSGLGVTVADVGGPLVGLREARRVALQPRAGVALEARRAACYLRRARVARGGGGGTCPGHRCSCSNRAGGARGSESTVG